MLKNTYRSHEFVNILSRIEADKGIVFNYADNQKLKESGFAVEGKTVNGFVDTNTGAVTLNVQSAKSWQSVVGHEITHVLEGTDAYEPMQKALFAYAESKGELASRRGEITELYKGMNADIDSELTAELIGDYLFTDKDFVTHLTSDRNLFQKIYDEIKYLYKVAPGKEQKENAKVKKEFDKAWKELNVKPAEFEQKNNTAENGVKYGVRVEFASELQEWFDSTTHDERKISGKRFLVGSATKVLKSIGVRDYNIYFGGSKIDKIITDNLSMDLEIIKQAVNLLEEPILIMKSRTVENSIVIFGDVYANNKPVMISVLLNPETKNGDILDYAVITSAYGRRKSNLQNLINESKIYYVDNNKKRTDKWLKALGLQLPSAITKYGFINSIYNSIENVNKNSLSNDTDDIAPAVAENVIADVPIRGDVDVTVYKAIKKYNLGRWKLWPEG